jgi:hypothetical protein
MIGIDILPRDINPSVFSYGDAGKTDNDNKLSVLISSSGVDTKFETVLSDDVTWRVVVSKFCDIYRKSVDSDYLSDFTIKLSLNLDVVNFGQVTIPNAKKDVTRVQESLENLLSTYFVVDHNAYVDLWDSVMFTDTFLFDSFGDFTKDYE